MLIFSLFGVLVLGNIKHFIMVPKSFHTTPPLLSSTLNVPLLQISTVYLFRNEQSHIHFQLLILTNTFKHQLLYYFYTYNDNNCKQTKIVLLGRTDLHQWRFSLTCLCQKHFIEMSYGQKGTNQNRKFGDAPGDRSLYLLFVRRKRLRWATRTTKGC